MPTKILGASITLGANASDTLILTPSRDLTVHKVKLVASGKFSITRIDWQGRELVDGEIHIDPSLTSINVIELPEAEKLVARKDVIFELTDLSGASNTINISLISTE